MPFPHTLKASAFARNHASDLGQVDAVRWEGDWVLPTSLSHTHLLLLGMLRRARKTLWVLCLRSESVGAPGNIREAFAGIRGSTQDGERDMCSCRA